MKTLENAPKGLQALLVVLGLGFMIANFADTFQLFLPRTLYGEQEILSLILNAAQVWL